MLRIQICDFHEHLNVAVVFHVSTCLYVFLFSCIIITLKLGSSSLVKFLQYILLKLIINNLNE